ncbi:MAG: Xaa-Pro aminopeptidase [Candidatus Accumulibacter regalis]|jgi:Xaa-Pro aminopeptidase|uniref:Xaa-Pro aminopeptidase n=1 Tax=Accumulibacter regalis TaxID=522306 RepID=A0A011RB80_ACCRE|nr:MULTISPECIES: aminopeptidase P N-terminal domain-containing protein [unclassified Candidatus Accumulibacter]EXI88439.1 MAG: Xaa-Pro aminopeptidase [Candidatus Accumulibacter regalis]MQM34884.1 peptidase M24 family protein [Candidatus Accumulibacter phosphatis]MBN8513104.1 aminopeptidase P N-terminal domain-containing protein [Accumulibacter sp.]MBO3703774.1 aminopeptidase P N-terminal domain-containing protein [Accumulibacter sp.]HRE71062.1 aminopeptidase P N-terminal domain-containing prot
MSLKPYAKRRQRVLDSLGDGVAVLATAPERLRNRDSHYPYRFDSYFWYLSGFPEPDAVIVLVGGAEAKAILFCREKNEERETWDGFRYGPDAAAAAFGFTEAHPIGCLDEMLPTLIANHAALWHSLGHDREWDSRIGNALNAVRSQGRSGTRAPGEIRDLRGLLDQMRLSKDAHEVQLMRHAADIASAGHSRAMRACRPGMAEYELEAELSYEFRRRGADGHAYTPIVAGGANACILHYVDNNKLLAGQSLVLIDAGCEVAGYASDITRTFPVGGRFSAEQREVYEIVLAAQQAAIAAVHPGASFTDYHQAALRVLTQGLIDLKLLTGSVDGAVESEAYKPWYMHRTGHWLGLDVHDAGDYKTGTADDDWVKLAAGMTLTVEPGLYLRPGSAVPEHLHGIGVRIEDDVLVTSDGCLVYTNAPRTVAEIEEVMRHE